MPEKIKTIVKLIENIGFIAFGISNGIIGVHLWWFHPSVTVSLCILSIILILRGVTELWGNFY